MKRRDLQRRVLRLVVALWQLSGMIGLACALGAVVALLWDGTAFVLDAPQRTFGPTVAQLLALIFACAGLAYTLEKIIDRIDGGRTV